MNMNDFRQHLQHINGSLNTTQRNLNNTPKEGIMHDVSPAEAESPEPQPATGQDHDMLTEDKHYNFLQCFVEDENELNENNIDRAIINLNNVAIDVMEYLDTGKEELEPVFEKYIESYFGDNFNNIQLNEEISDEDIFKSIEELIETYSIIDKYFNI